MNNKNTQNSIELRFKITLDEKKIPESIDWEADGVGVDGRQLGKSLMISIWDPQNESTVSHDLWTKDMTHHEMSTFMFQSLLMMAKTYNKATGNSKLAGELQNFAEEFGIKAKVIRLAANDEITPFKLEL